jgi:hypothetical protein
MKKFIENNFTVIVLIIVILTFFKGCNDSREISKIRKEMTVLRDSVATKGELNKLYQKTDDLQNTIWGFGDSFNFVMNKFVDSSIDNKATNKAFEMYSKKAKELNKGSK